MIKGSVNVDQFDEQIKFKFFFKTGLRLMARKWPLVNKISMSDFRPLFFSRAHMRVHCCKLVVERFRKRQLLLPLDAKFEYFHLSLK